MSALLWFLIGFASFPVLLISTLIVVDDIRTRRQKREFHQAMASWLRFNAKHCDELRPDILKRFGHAPPRIDAERIISGWS